MWNRLSFVFIASLSARCLWCVSIGRFVEPSLPFVRTRGGHWMSMRRALTAAERRGVGRAAARGAEDAAAGGRPGGRGRRGGRGVATGPGPTRRERDGDAG